jgi:hypothetical protein
MYVIFEVRERSFDFYRDEESYVFFFVKKKLNRKGVMVFYATFNNISVISWRSVLLVEEY